MGMAVVQKNEKISAETKLHILQVHNFYQIPGGEDQVVRNEARLLTKHGHSVFCYNRKNAEITSMSLLQKARLPFETVFSVKTFVEVRRLIKQEKIDIVHVHNTLALISPSVFYAALSCRVPVVLTVHNFRLLCPGALFYRDGKICEECVQKGLLCSVKYGCYRNSRMETLLCAFSMQLQRLLGTYRRLYYICLTDFNKEKLLELRQIRRRQVFVKSNYVEDGGKIVPAKEREAYFLYAGRLEEDKGVKVLLRAFRILRDRALTGENADALPQIPALIVCGNGSLAKWCGAYIKKHGLTNVSLQGSVSNEVVRELMSRARGVIVPSLLYEGFPVVIAEAFGARTPVIGSDLGNVGGLITEWVNGVRFRTGDAKALADTIMTFDPVKIRFEDADKAVREWQEEGNYRKLIRIYERCISDVRKAEEK